ncbi:MAG: VTT domain-containing protein [Candidatus Omnitrophica bacterium]|nr:VTT domain-containing protein [Candidatus Omnitrophota bacterium]
MEEITRRVLEAIQNHGPAAVFIGVLIESVIVPIPSPLIIMGAGAVLLAPGLSFAGLLSPLFFSIVLPGSIAATLGAFIGYGIGFWGGKPIIDRLQRFLGFGWKEVSSLEKRLMEKHGGLLLMLLRALPIMPLSLISAAAGVVRWPLGSFTLWTWLGSVPRCFVLGYLGWLTRDTYDALAHRFDKLETVSSAALLAGIVGLILWLRAKTRG